MGDIKIKTGIKIMEIMTAQKKHKIGTAGKSNKKTSGHSLLTLAIRSLDWESRARRANKMGNICN